MAADESAPPGGSAAAPRSRSQRSRNRPAGAAANETAGADDRRPQPQREEEEEERPPPFALMPILNWIVFFYVMQNVVGPMVAKFVHPDSSPTVAKLFEPIPPPDSGVPPGSPPTEEFGEAGRIPDGSDGDDGRRKGKPLGATQHGAKKPAKPLTSAKPSCIWETGTVMDLDVVLTDSSDVPAGWPSLTTPIDEPEANRGGGKVLASWREEDLILGGVADGADSRTGFSIFFMSDADQDMNRRNATLTAPLTPAIWNNETHLYAYVRLQRRRRFDDGVDTRKRNSKRKDDVLVKRVSLTRHRKRKKTRDVKSLLDSSSGSEEDSATAAAGEPDSSVLTTASLNKTHDQTLMYLKPSLTLQIMDMGPVDFPNRKSMPRQFLDHMDWYEGEGDGRPTTSELYYPILYSSEFWITFASLKEVNGTMKESDLEITYEPVPMWKWQLQSQTEESWRKQEAFTGEEDHGNDMLREMLLETNPYLLAVTGIVSVLHTIFDILAFKNDISFFKNKKSMEGISLRSMIVNSAFSLVILLYLADNETSFMVLMSNGVGLAIEVWKISKAITVKFEGGKIEWVEAQSYKKSKTKEYDEIATSHLMFVTMPLVAGYGVYSLFYQKHKGWYSWILNTLVGFIYMFGFVMMTPQLFINYKLQSVAHLNWRTMTYKSINTFIDDLFAFVIKMPIMHRLACLRDDLIFFITLFQRYKYKTDYTRVNEFGQCSQPTEEMLVEREAEREQENAAVADQPNSSVVGKRRGAREKRD
ncbi:hypothetical protein ACHAWF_018708 [Thalassiosira exigua]